MVRKILALVLVGCGIAAGARGLLHWREPALPPESPVRMYVMSRQVEDLQFGFLLVALAGFVYWGWRK